MLGFLFRGLTAEPTRGAPLFAGSGVDASNLSAALEIADGVIVGTAFKQQGTEATISREEGRGRVSEIC